MKFLAMGGAGANDKGINDPVNLCIKEQSMTFTKLCNAVGITAFVSIGLVYQLIKLLENPKGSTNRTKPVDNPDESSSAICPCCSRRIRLTKKS
jgi:hypothetical protein